MIYINDDNVGEGVCHDRAVWSPRSCLDQALFRLTKTTTSHRAPLMRPPHFQGPISSLLLMPELASSVQPSLSWHTKDCDTKHRLGEEYLPLTGSPCVQLWPLMNNSLNTYSRIIFDIMANVSASAWRVTNDNVIEDVPKLCCCCYHRYCYYDHCPHSVTLKQYYLTIWRVTSIRVAFSL